ncbi:C6 finger domain-containing protein [Stagonosporopsis vannaccii]|nr:C6 finger domain-containing protein [Stagonosporopsis vannaccii]
MVSRGGRSKGCFNCRKRRVKCDETRPVCLRCLKRGLECDGPRPVTWINQNTDFQSESSPENAVVLASPSPTPPPQLSFDAFGEMICLAYTRKNLLKGGPVELACNMIEVPAGGPDFERPGVDLLRRSLLSLSVTFFGKQHRQNQITRRGYAQYGEVLRILNSHLAQPELQTTDETILTALTCMLLEIFLPTGPKNFFKHHRGLEAIMAMRGPPTETTGDTATIFRGLRILSIIGAVAESRPSLYAREEWKRVPPPANATEVMILQHHILACLADCTQLMGDRDALLNGTAPLCTYEPLRKRVQSTMEDLQELYPLYECYNASQANMPRPSTPLAVELGVSNYMAATVLMLYNTVLICLLQIIDSLDPSPSNTVLRNKAAMVIAKCLELKEYERREGVYESNTIAFVATKIAWQALGGFDSPEGRRLAKSVNEVLTTVTPMPINDKDAWEQARPEDVRDNFFGGFVKRYPVRAQGVKAKKAIFFPPESDETKYTNGSGV